MTDNLYQQCEVFVITNNERDKFFACGEYFTRSVITAEHYETRADAEYALDVEMNDFQREITHEIVPFQITISEVKETK